MRLGQLARKLSLRPSQLVDFLASNDIKSEEGSNTRLTDAHTRMIVQYFAPESLEEIMKPAVKEVDQSEPETEPGPEEAVTMESESKATESNVSGEDRVEEQETEPEVIRVQKIELSGLKVLGKIELPEPKKKEPKPESESTEEEKTKSEKRGPSKSKHPGRERDQRTWRNPLDAQRKREAREMEEKRRAELEREKERKRSHYENKVKHVQRPKKTKTVKEAVIVSNRVDKRPAPKTWIGKFLRWWTT